MKPGRLCSGLSPVYVQYARQLERGEPEPSKRYVLPIQRIEESQSAERHVKKKQYRRRPPEILGGSAVIFRPKNDILHISAEVQHDPLLEL
ncbi:MAG: hypothetical protein LiPW30_59 [Parcubacteria group bacterium LiPW_30]|mgnify:CR=1|nr:MAG: hypothetical protein LiPW30_59 [Parcubacteria group bacterium LiPW_30]